MIKRSLTGKKKSSLNIKIKNMSRRFSFILLEKGLNMKFFSGPYFPVFGLNLETYGVNTAKTPHLDIFRAVLSPSDLKLLPSRHTDDVKTSLTGVALTSLYSCDEKATLGGVAKTTLLQHVIKTTSFQQPRLTLPSQLCSDARATSDSDVAATL